MTPRRRLPFAWGTVLLLGLACVAAAGPAATQAPLRVSGPYVYENLDVYLLHGEDQAEGQKLTPLSEALAGKKVVVRETGNVSQLAIENLSDEPVYLQAGDIVKGGRQDRVLQNDMVLPPKSGRVPLDSFCVEQGRWQGRGAEAADHFAANSAKLAHKDLKLANYRKSQGEVWSNVDKVQRQLSANLGGDARGVQSNSSLQLTLENDRVRKGVAGYVRALSGIVATANDARGVVVAINGQLNCAEVYASRALFVKLWPQLLHASAVEAVAERKTAAAHTPPTVDAVETFLAQAENGQAKEGAASGAARSKAVESETSVMIETRTGGADKPWLHKSYVRK